MASWDICILMSCHLLRVGKHIDTHRGGSSACPDNDDNDDEDEDGEANNSDDTDIDDDDHGHFKDYIGIAVI